MPEVDPSDVTLLTGQDCSEGLIPLEGQAHQGSHMVYVHCWVGVYQVLCHRECHLASMQMW